METGNSGSEDLSLNAARRVELQALRDDLNSKIAQGRGNDLSSDYLLADGDDDRRVDDLLAFVYGEGHIGVSVFDVPTSRLPANNRLGLVDDTDSDPEGEESRVDLGVRANLVGLGLLAHDEDGDAIDEGDGVEEGDEIDESSISPRTRISGVRAIEPMGNKRMSSEFRAGLKLPDSSAAWRRRVIREARRISPKNKV